MVQHSSDVSRAPRKLSRTISYLTLTSPRGRSACRTCLGILVVLTCTASATLDAQAADTLPARLIHVSGDTAALIIPDTVRRGHAFTVTVTAFAGGCIREGGGSRVSVDGLVADVTPLHVRRVVGNACTSDLILLPQNISLRFDRAGLGRIRFHGAANRLDSGAPPQWVVIERTVVVR
jgi:hypothetical protein